MINIKAVSQVNSSYIHLNEDGQQSRIKTTKNDINDIIQGFKTELEHIEYSIEALEQEMNMYSKLIEMHQNSIESLNATINQGIVNNIPKYKRGLSEDHSNLTYYKTRLNDSFMYRSGLNGMNSKLLDRKMHIQKILRECESVKF